MDGKGRRAQVKDLACGHSLLDFLLSFPTPGLDYQKIQAQFRRETRTNCLNGNHYAAHDSALTHYLQEGDTLTPGVPGLLAQGKEQGHPAPRAAAAAAQKHGMADPGAGCLRSSPGPWSCSSC